MPAPGSTNPRAGINHCASHQDPGGVGFAANTSSLQPACHRLHSNQDQHKQQHVAHRQHPDPADTAATASIAQAVAAAACTATSAPCLSWVLVPQGVGASSGTSSDSGGDVHLDQLAAAARVALSLAQRLAQVEAERAQLAARLEASERRLAAVRAAVSEGG